MMIQGFIGSSFDVEHLSPDAMHKESFANVLIGLLEWDEHERNQTDSFPESETESEKEKSESEDSNFFELAEQGHHSFMSLPERLTFNDIRALNSGSGKIPTPPPEVWSFI